MLSAVEVKPDVYWVGGVDWSARSFHGYTTEKGITYNAYLIMDEKITLIDTTRHNFSDELIARIKNVVDPSKIDVIICNHVEMDHSGSIPEIAKLAPQATIYASAPQGVKELIAHYGELNYAPVKTGDTLNIGKRTLTFVQTPMVHWPDNMVTYSAYDKILFSNDAFGQHYATSVRFDDECEVSEVLNQARKYYANIVYPYSRQADAAVTAVRNLGSENVEMIAPSHGLIWRSHVEDVLKLYEELTSGVLKEEALVVYDTMWHSTEEIAKSITDGFMAAGIPVHLMDLKANNNSDAMTEFSKCKYVCVGSPTLNSQMLPTVAGFLTYMKGLSPNNENRVGMAFGSYGWAPLGPNNVHKELEACKFNLPVECQKIGWIPSEEDLDGVRAQVAKLIEAGQSL